MFLDRYHSAERDIQDDIPRKPRIEYAGAIQKETHVAYGTPVDLSVNEGKIMIDTHTQQEYRLEDLIEGISKKNIHAEVETGDAVGREVW